MLRVALCTCAVLTAAACSVVPAQTDLEPYRQPLQALLADEVTPEVELPEKLREVTLSRPR